MKILLDTDIGSDIDDCFALAYLLCRKDIEILGITTVSGLADIRARLADKICKTAGRKIPIHVGAEQSLAGKLRQANLTNAQILVAKSNECIFPKKNTAIEFMRKTIESNPNEITLICIGQLTNAAMLFEQYPHIPSLLGGMLIMGGRYTNDPAFDTKKWGATEWNILCDAAAAEIVFKQKITNFMAIGIEQTSRFCIPPAPIKKAILGIPKLRAASDSINTIAEQVYFHDAILIYAWLHPKEVTLVRGNIKTEITDQERSSATRFTPSDKGWHTLITDFSPELFIEDFTNTLGIKLSDIIQL